jgi:hypothetical protein
MGKYLYCIIPGGAPREFAHSGIGDDGGLVQTVACDGLAAVISDSPIIEYDRSRRYMMAHTLILEEAMAGATILPVRFGTVATSAEAISEQVLSRRHDELTGLLTEMDGLVELGVKAFWLEDTIFPEIVREAPASMRTLQEKIQGRPPDQMYRERMQLGEMVQSAMDRKRDEDADRLLAGLTPLCREYKVNALFMDRMVLNAAFLVEAGRQPAFDAAMRKLDAESVGRLQFKYVGPVPPYNFVSITIKWDA